MAGAEWAYSKSIFLWDPTNGFHINPSYTWGDFFSGFRYSVPFLFILTVHEFGHYFTAMYHKIKASLPYYIPVPPIILSIGTLGAIIRIRSRVFSNIQHFDIGLAGPLSGFIVAVVILIYGFRTLPPPEYIFQIHPEYKEYGLNYADHVYTKEYLIDHKANEEDKFAIDITFGSNLLFFLLEKFVADPSRVPNAHEMMHYPILMAGFLALFFTSLNLLPIGQLDGGHVVYGLFGRKGHRIIAVSFFLLLLVYSGLGYTNIHEQKDQLWWLVPTGIIFYMVCLSGLRLPFRDTLMYALLIVAFLLVVAWMFPKIEGYSGWLIFGLLVGRVLGVHHPPSEIEQPLDPKRQVLGWICLLIFILSFSPQPIMLTEINLTP